MEPKEAVKRFEDARGEGFDPKKPVLKGQLLRGLNHCTALRSRRVGRDQAELEGYKRKCLTFLYVHWLEKGHKAAWSCNMAASGRKCKLAQQCHYPCKIHILKSRAEPSFVENGWITNVKKIYEQKQLIDQCIPSDFCGASLFVPRFPFSPAIHSMIDKSHSIILYSENCSVNFSKWRRKVQKN